MLNNHANEQSNYVDLILESELFHRSKKFAQTFGPKNVPLIPKTTSQKSFKNFGRHLSTTTFSSLTSYKY